MKDLIKKPNIGDYPDYCQYYFDLVSEEDLILNLKSSFEETNQIFASLPAEKYQFKYADNKWTILEVLRHIIDCERVYSYRAFRFSRFDRTALSGFDENKYIENVDSIEIDSLLTEYAAIRTSTICLFDQMNEKSLDFRGKANNVFFTPRSFGYMTVGHNLHHINLIKKLYL